MSLQCMAPDLDLGVALRLATFLDCQSRALGENGFQALAGGAAMAAVLSGLITIFVALIGYRMILGWVPSLSDGVGWAVRLGFVLALVTSWPAFQTLIYRVMIDGPQELAASVLPAAGLSSDNIGARIQNAYDDMRRGSSGPDDVPNAPGSAQGSAGLNANPPVLSPSQPYVPGMAPMPQTASLLVVSTSGLIGALHIVVGFLIAIGPIAVLCLLFQGTISVFEGWFRALAGAAFGVFAANVTTAIELVVIESEIAHAQAVKIGADAAASFDPQALITIVLLFAVIALSTVLAAIRVASAFRFRLGGFASRNLGESIKARETRREDSGAMPRQSDGLGSAEYRSRAMVVANALSAAVHRDRGEISSAEVSQSLGRRASLRQNGDAATAAQIIPLGIAGRRSSVKRTQSAQRRDRSV